MSHLWAKSDGSPLLGHLLDVTRQGAQFVKAYRPQWPLKDNVQLHRVLAYASLIHDFGKVHPGFQAMLCDRARPFGNRHEVLSLAFLDWLEIPEEEWRWLAAAVATHHKGWNEIGPRFKLAGSENSDLGKLSRGVPEEDAALLYEVLERSPELIRECGWDAFAPYPLRPPERLDYGSSLEAAIDRIGRFLQPPKAAGPLRPGPQAPRDWGRAVAGIQTRGWLLSSDHLASFGWRPIEQRLVTTTEVEVMYPGFEWRAHQKELASYDGSAVLIAPTGSGKTEAGLLWAGRQAEAGARGRVCVLLPYQASLNAMQRRLVGRLDPASVEAPERWNETVGLLHGRAARHLYEAFMSRDYAAAKAERLARDQNDLARLFAAPVAVSTVFSVVRLLFATRGAERLFAAFSGARIVVDEIHAYTPDVTALTLAALTFLQEHLGARVLFMSATVPPHLERALGETMGVRRVPAEPPWGEKVRHRLEFLEGDCLSNSAREAILGAAEGGSVLVVVNQVRRAVELRNRLDGLVPVQLLHSRFHFKDRARIEADLGPKPGGVLIGTQAVEVSLDVDFDTCFSELAPVESLAQRFGRCNRRGTQSRPAAAYVFSSFPKSQRGYLPYDEGHLAQVKGVLEEFLRGGSRDLSDSDVHVLLGKSYPRQMQEDLSRSIAEKTGRMRRVFLDDWEPFGVARKDERERLEREWEKLFDGLEVLPEPLLQVASEASSWFERTRYFVPISGDQFMRFRDRIEENEELGCRVIRRPYGETGLDLHGP